MIYGIIKGQHLSLKAYAVADSIDYLTASFTFISPDWEGLTVYAHFTKGDETHSVELADGKITEADHLNLTEGEWGVYLHGNEYKNGDVLKRITTNIEKFNVEPTGTLDGDPFPEVEPSVVEQLEADVEQLEADVADCKERLDTDEAKLATIESYAQKNVQPDWAQLDTSADDYIKNKIVKGTIESGDTGYVTGGDVYNAIQTVNTELYEIAAVSTTALYTGAEIYALYQAHKPLAYMSYPVILAVRSSSAAYGQVALYFCSGGSPAVIRSATIPNTAKTITIAHSGTTVTDANNTKLNAIHDGVIASGDTGYVTGGAVYESLQTHFQSYIEISTSASVSKYTGAELHEMWQSGAAMTYQGMLIFAENYTPPSSYAFYAIKPVPSVTNERVTVIGFSVGSDKAITSVNTVAYMLTDAQENKLNNISTGSITSGDTGYITGDAAYDALAAKQDTLTAGANITIQNDVISAEGGGDAEDITYDNTDSGLTATDVQAAIDELASSSGGGFIAQSTAPSDTSLLWIDIDDNTIDETLANGDTSSY